MTILAMEAVFLAVCAVNSLVPGRWAPSWYNDFLRPYHNIIFAFHAIATFLVLAFAVGDNQWKYIPATFLVCLLYDFGFLWTEDFFTLKNTIFIGFHHAGPLIAFYFQTPEQAWANSLLYCQFWIIHSFPVLKTFLGKFGVNVAKDSAYDYWSHIVYAVMTPVTYFFYVQSIPVAWNYAAAALFSQVFGRWLCANNICKFTWMNRIEAPGVITVFFYSYGGLMFAIPALLLYIVTVYLLIERASNDGKCSKLVLTDEIREFVRTFPDETEPLTKEKVESSCKWFDSQTWAADYPLFRAVMLRENDKVSQLLKDGADHTQVHGEWWHSVPMQWAASGGGVSTMKVLIEAGANPFYKGVYDGARMFKQEYSLSFLDQLQEFALKDEEIVSRVNVELLESPVTYAAAAELASSKGGRLVTTQEAESVFKHRAAETASDDCVDTKSASCFATSESDSPTTFTCKFTKNDSTPTPAVVGGDICATESTCSLLMWIKPKEKKEDEQKNKSNDDKEEKLLES